MTMTTTDIAVAVYDLHTQAEAAVKAMQRAGFDMKKSRSSAGTTTPRNTLSASSMPAIGP